MSIKKKKRRNNIHSKEQLLQRPQADKNSPPLWIWFILGPLLIIAIAFSSWAFFKDKGGLSVLFLDSGRKEQTKKNITNTEKLKINPTNTTQTRSNNQVSAKKIQPKDLMEPSIGEILNIPTVLEPDPNDKKVDVTNTIEEIDNVLLETENNDSGKGTATGMAVPNKQPAQNSSTTSLPSQNKEDPVLKELTSVCRLPQAANTDKTNTSKISFNKWLENFKTEALLYEIPKKVIKQAFKGVKPIKKVIELDRRQSEYSITFSKYLSNSISADRISTGKRMLKMHRTHLKRLEKKYGVQPQFLIAFWAMESNFGKNMGNFPTISTIATLAHEGRRSSFFRGELLCALQLVKEGHVIRPPNKMKSSWAGAMGQPQFMPSTLYHYGADGNTDGKLDIWNNVADVLASSANYLSKAGWSHGQTWGLEVKLPTDFDPYIAKFSETRSIKEWRNQGVKKANGKKILFDENARGAIILPSGIKGPAFLVLNNFRVIREWNRSINYALAVAHLSDRLIGKRPLIARDPAGEKPLSRKQSMTLQSNLKKLGFYADKIDGMIGLKSRDAIREYQRSRNIPADAYPYISLIKYTQQDLISIK